MFNFTLYSHNEHWCASWSWCSPTQHWFELPVLYTELQELDNHCTSTCMSSAHLNASVAHLVFHNPLYVLHSICKRQDALSFRMRQTIQHGFSPDGNWSSDGIIHTEWLPNVWLKHSVPNMENFEGWWWSSCCSSLVALVTQAKALGLIPIDYRHFTFPYFPLTTSNMFQLRQDVLTYS